MIYLLKLFFFTDTFSIRRVGDDDTVFFSRFESGDRQLPEFDAVFHSRFYRVFFRCRKCLRIDIRSNDADFRFRIDRVKSGFSFFFPIFLRDEEPFFGSEFPGKSGSNIFGDHRRLDRNGPRSAERIDKKSA